MFLISRTKGEKKHKDDLTEKTPSWMDESFPVIVQVAEKKRAAGTETEEWSVLNLNGKERQKCFISKHKSWATKKMFNCSWKMNPFIILKLACETIQGG